MSGATYPIGFSYTKALDASVADDAIDPGSVGLCNTDTTTGGTIAVQYWNGDTGELPIGAGEYLAVARCAVLLNSGTTAAIADKIIALYH